MCVCVCVCDVMCAQISVQTGDVRGAGTDSDISVQLFGSKGESQEMKLESSADNFERNKVWGLKHGHLVCMSMPVSQCPCQGRTDGLSTHGKCPC